MSRPRRRSCSPLLTIAAVLAGCGGPAPSPSPSWFRSEAPSPYQLEWADGPWPLFIGHRGGARYLPENTLAAFDACAAAQVPVETDVRMSSDAQMVLIHDSTVDRTTDGTGPVAGMTLAQLRALNASAYWAGAYPPTAIPSFDEYLRLGTRTLLAPESYTTGTAREIAATVKRARAERSVLMHTFVAADATEAHAVDPALKVMLLGPRGAPPPLETLRIVGAWASAPEAADVTPQYVAECHAAGLKVITWVVDRVVDAEAMLAVGVDGLVSNDPLYLRMLTGSVTPSGAEIRVPDRLPAAGWSGTREPGSGPGLSAEAGFARPHAGTYFVYPPIRLPDGSWRVATTLKLLTRDADATRFVGLRFGMTRDRDPVEFFGPGYHGYYVAFAADGAVQIGRGAGNVATPLATATWTPLAAGDTIPIVVTVTPTTLSVQHATTLATLTATDATYSRAGFVDAFGSVNVVGLGATTVLHPYP